MSSKKRRSVCQEELEVQRVLSPGDSRSTVSAARTPTAGQRQETLTTVAYEPAVLQGLFDKMSQTLLADLEKSGLLRSTPRGPMSDAAESSEEEYDSELPTGLPSVASDTAPPLFGVDVNEPMRPGSAGEHAYALPPIEAQVKVVPPPGSGAVPRDMSVMNRDGVASTSSAAAETEVEPDSSLPLSTGRVPTNWHPDEKTMAWAALVLDTTEWSKADREVLSSEFSPEPKYDHLFEAVPTPPDLLNAMKHPLTKERDYLFNRYEAESQFYSANLDLSSGLRPLLEVLSNLKDKPEMNHNRLLLARVFQAIASSASHMSRGRRELGRPFVPLANAPALFQSKPSHFCLFGGKSLEDAVQQAVGKAKVNKDLVHMPKKRKSQPFRSSGPSGQSYSYGKSSYQPGYSQSSKKNFQGRRKPRKSGKGRGGKSQHQPKASGQE